ncbi:replicase [Grapevine virus M]|nr:replicase [Grapevine virus M]
MAISVNSQRSAVSNLFCNGSSAEVEAIKTLKTKALLSAEEHANGLFDYHVSDFIKDQLAAKGIHISVHSFQSHPHPISKMIENHLLYNVLAQYVTNTTLFISCKESKIKRLTVGKNKNILKNHRINRLIHAKDALRYLEPLSNVDFSDTKTMSELTQGATRVVIHDEVQYWSLGDFQRFLGAQTGVEEVLYTLIYPAEIEAGYTGSLFPEAYTFELHEGYFVWRPDGKADGWYRQPVNSWLLTTRKTIDSQGRTWTITKLTTIASHHLFFAKKGSLVTEDCYAYDDYTLIDPKAVLKGKRNRGIINLRERFITPCLLYLLALKKPDAHSAVAKLRQLTHGEENPCEALFLAQLAKQIQGNSLFDKMGNFEAKAAFWGCFMAVLPEPMRYLVDSEEYHRSSFEDFVRRLKTAEVKIERHFRDYQPDRRFELTQGVGDADWDGVIREGYIEMLREKDRVPDPYLTTGQTGLDKWNNAVSILNAARLEASTQRNPEVVLNEVVPICMEGYMHNFRKALTNRSLLSATTCLLLTYPLNPKERLNPGLSNLVEVDANQAKLLATPIGKTAVPMKVGGCDCLCKYIEESRLEGCSLMALSNDLRCPDDLKGRKAGFYSRNSGFYTYNGGSHKSLGWPTVLQEIANKLGLDEGFDHCLIQSYEEGGKIGFHRDDEKCYDGQQSVVTLNLIGDASFKVKCEHGAQKDYSLHSGDVLTMREGAQSAIWHSVRSESSGRMSLTFRNHIIGGDASDVDTISEYEESTPQFDDSLSFLQDNKKSLCALDCFAEHMKAEREICISTINAKNPRLVQELEKGGATLPTLIQTSHTLGYGGMIHREGVGVQVRGGPNPINLEVLDGHVRLSTLPLSTSTFQNAMELGASISKAVYNLEYTDARVLANSFEEGNTGILLDKHKAGKFQVPTERRAIEVYTSFGFAGSGKSHYPQCVLKCCEVGKVMVVSPRKALAHDWEIKTDKRCIIRTHEKALVEGSRFDAVIFDEIGLLPHGYLDLFFLLRPSKCYLLLGDPLQNSYHGLKDEITLSPIKNGVFSKIVGDVSYLLYTHRLPKQQKCFDIPSLAYSPKEDYLLFGDKIPDGCSTLVCSRKAKDAHKGEAFTIGESQGLSFNEVYLKLDQDWGLISDETVVVAFTRARQITHVIGSKGLISHLVQKARSDFLKKILSRRTIGKFDLLANLRKKITGIQLVEQEERFADTDDLEDKLANDPYLKGLLQLFEHPGVEEPEAQEEQVPEPTKTHLYLSTSSNDLDPYNLKAKEMREQKVNGLLTEQIDEVGYKGEAANPSTHKALYLQHKNSDVSTFMLSVRKRLRFRDLEKNRRRYNKARECKIGEQLWGMVRKTYDLKAPLYLPPLDEAAAKFTEKRLQKSANLIEKHSYRSDPDWPSNYLKIFLKQQLCTKMEKRGIDAKAGQTIACFAHSVLCRFGPHLRRTENLLRMMLPDNVMIYSQKDYKDLDAWCKTYVHTFEGTDSDYEAFDRSQDEKILCYEVEVLKFFLWPEYLINEYVELKLMMGCDLGDLAIMRFSGEFGTFFFNTICNMAFTCMRYFINKDTPICFAGDDMYSPGTLKQRKDYEEVLGSLTLKAKVHYSNEPLFCGWRMSPYGIVKDPNLLLDRWKIAQRDGKLETCMVNYAIEACFGYRLGEMLYDLKIDLDAQQELTRLIVLVKHRLPKGVAQLFSRLEDECGSDGEDLSFKLKPEGGLDEGYVDLGD